MHLVALTRFGRGLELEQELPILAKALGLGLYDLRLKLAAPLPTVLASCAALEPAQELLALLRRRGHGAVACAASSVPTPAQALSCRSFTLEPDAFVGSDDARRSFSLPYAQILGIVRAVQLSSESQTLETTEKKFAIGRALLSGGVMLNKTVTKVETSGSSERQHVAYVFQSTTPAPLLLKEHALSYEGLGAKRGTTARASFDALIAELRSRTPEALCDDRLLAHKRQADLTAVRGLTKDRGISNSNAPANGLAAYLLMLGHLQQQL